MKLRERFWGVVGGLAVMTGGVCASEPGVRSGSSPASNESISANQQAANEIAAAIAREVTDRGYTVNLDVRNGVATLRGSVSSPTQMHRILEVTRTRPYVKRVINELKIAGQEPVQTAAYQNAALSDQAPAPMPQTSPEQTLNAATPEFSFPQGAAPQYDAPFMPPFSWPAKAPYPNYSAVQYPMHYPRNAWPNIGPFHPYPEPPLDWREVKAYSLSGLHPIHFGQTPPPEWSVVKLRWEDGHWYLGFCHARWGGRTLLSGLGHTEEIQPVPCGSCVPGGGYHLWFNHKVFTHLFMD